MSAGELPTDIGVRHPSRNIDDPAIDHDLDAGSLRVSDHPHDTPFLAKKGVQRVLYPGLTVVAGIENITLANSVPRQRPVQFAPVLADSDVRYWCQLFVVEEIGH